MSRTWFTSDTHFGHERIIELAGRPFDSVEEMNAVMVERWNATVGIHDTVYHCGDAVMGTFADNIQILGQLNGMIQLVPGNHDRVSSVYHHRNPAAAERFRQMYIDQGVYILPEHIYGWCDMNMSHYPYVGDSHADDRYTEMRPIDNGLPLIHGHVHEEWRVNDRMLNVGVDVWDFTPISFDTVRDFLATC